MPQPVPTKNDGSARERGRGEMIRAFGSGASGADQARRGGPQTVAGYLWIIYEGRRTVLLVTVATLLVGVIAMLLMSPTYEAQSVLRVEQRRATLAGLEEITSALGEDPAEAEIEIVRSRTLLGAVAEQLNLSIVAAPQYFPFVGEAIARAYRGKIPRQPPLAALSKYAWGGEMIDVDRLQVSDDLVSKPMVLTALEDHRFRITTLNGDLLVEGAVGSPAVSTGNDSGQAVDVLVSALVARPGTTFTLRKRPPDGAIDALKTAVQVRQRGRRTGIIVVSMIGTSPKHVASIVDAVTTTYLRQNVERKSAEAAKTLAFIESQLPQLKENLDRSEKALNSFRVSSGTVNSSAETQATLEREREYDRQISELELRRSQLRQSFTENHPNLLAIANQLAQLRAERGSLQGKMKLLPKAEVDSARLAREVNDATNLYVGLLNKAQELRVVKSGTIGDVRIIDRAHVPRKPAGPNSGIILALSLMLGLCLGSATAIVRKSLAKCAENADDVEGATGLPVYVVVPRSETHLDAAKRSGAAGSLLLAKTDPTGPVAETLRSLRTSLQFALVESRNAVVAVTGPAPGVGKSFIALNLAQVIAAAGRKVLVVDADLRRGRLHRQFGINRKPGLSDVVSGTATLEEAIRPLETENLFLLPTGRIPPNPAELLSTALFESLIEDLAQRFDMVIIDTPPILAVSDGILVARLAGVNLLVVRAGMHTLREIALATKQFALNGVRLHGSVLNDVRATRGGKYGTDGYVRYEYTSEVSE